MSARSTGSRALLGLAVMLPLLLGGLLIVVATVPGERAREVLVGGLTDFVPVLTYLMTGALIELRRPGNRVGRALLLTASGFWAEAMLRRYAELALFVRPAGELPLGAEAAALWTAGWTVLMAGFFLLVIVFPTGALPSPRWRLVVVAGLTGFAVTAATIVVTPGQMDAPFDTVVNPFGMELGPWLGAVSYVLGVTTLLAVAAAVVNLVRRFRKAVGMERAQLKWLALSAGFLVATLPLGFAFGFDGLSGALVGLGLLLPPVAVAIAVLRYRLYDVDRIVSRTLTYGVLSAVLVGAYAGLVLAGQALFSSFAGGSNLAIAVSTLAVAALFMPVRARVQRFVDRRFYRRRYDAQRTLEGFGARLREQVDLATLQSDLGIVVEDTMQPAHISVWLRREVSP